jgi:uroporphyrinogen-III synthase
MRVLITRPLLQGGKTAAKLEQLGHVPVVFPLFMPIYDFDTLATALSGRFSALAFTSAEAVRCFRQEEDATMIPPSVPVFTVGAQTGRAAALAGFPEVISSIGGGKELATLIAGYYSAIGVPRKPVLYLASARRHGTFERILEEHGIPTTIAEVYTMVPVDYTLDELQEQLVNRPVDAVFLYSRETAQHFFSLPIFATSKAAISKTLFFCLSKNIAEAVPEELRNSAVVSHTPNEDELLDLL